MKLDEVIAEACLVFWRRGLHTWLIAAKTARLVAGYESTMNIALCRWVRFVANVGLRGGNPLEARLKGFQELL